MGVAVKVWLGTRDCVSCYRQRNFLKWVTVLQSGSESAVSNELWGKGIFYDVNNLKGL